MSALGIRHLVLLIGFGCMPKDATERSLRLFAEDVIPRVDRDPANI